MGSLENIKILLGVCGGIAAYKSPDIVRRLREQGAEVKVVITDAGKNFITPLTLQAVSGNPVYDNLWDPQALNAMAHIEMARFADLILIAPATADVIASLAHGFANDLLTTLCLASEAKIIIAPAMNQQMWQNAATQANIKILLERGVQLLGPDIGIQACGEFGPGRLLDSDELVKHVGKLCSQALLLQGVRVVVTAGPTQEAIDSVRCITNYSSGKMGYAIAEAAAAAGASVTLISGPVALSEPSQKSIHCVKVTTALQMHEAVMQEMGKCDLFIASAAVSDYRSEEVALTKQKKSPQGVTLHLIANPDILQEVAALAQPPFTVGFAAETDQVVEHAMQKLKKKRLSMIVANEVGKTDRGFNSDNNAVTVIWPEGECHFPLSNKRILAMELISLIAEHYHAKNTA